MIGALSRARRGRPSTAALVSVATLAFVAPAAVLVRSRADDGIDRRRRPVERYEAAVAPAAEQAGRAVVLGVRPDLREFEAGRLSPEQWQQNMQARSREFAVARAAFARARAPAVLREAAAWFHESLTLYIGAADVLAAAGAVQGGERTRLLELGTSLGESADRLFDRGAAHLQAARRSVGLSRSSRFSDKGFPAPREE